MNEYTFVIRTDKDLHDRIRKLAYLANTSRSAAIRKLLQSQGEEQQIAALTSSQVPLLCTRNIANDENTMAFYGENDQPAIPHASHQRDQLGDLPKEWILTPCNGKKQPNGHGEFQ